MSRISQRRMDVVAGSIMRSATLALDEVAEMTGHVVSEDLLMLALQRVGQRAAAAARRAMEVDTRQRMEASIKDAVAIQEALR